MKRGGWGVFIFYFKTGKLIMYRQQGHTFHLLCVTKSNISSTSRASYSASLLLDSMGGTPLTSTSARNSGRRSSFSSMVIDQMSKAQGHPWA